MEEEHGEASGDDGEMEVGGLEINEGDDGRKWKGRIKEV